MLTLAICLVAVLATPTLAAIYNITAPDRLWIGQAFTATLYESESPVTYNDFGVVFGLKNASVACETCVGTQINYTDLSTTPFKATLDLRVVVPDTIDEGNYTLVAAIPFLVGISGDTSFKYFTKQVTVKKLLGLPPPKCPPPCGPNYPLGGDSPDYVCGGPLIGSLAVRETPSIVCPLVGRMTAAPTSPGGARRAPGEEGVRRDGSGLLQRESRARKDREVKGRQCRLFC